MKRTLLLLTAAFLGTATAQTRIGSVTITRPATAPAQASPPRTQAPASAPRAAATTAATPAPVPSDLPAGWRMLSGRVTAANDVKLPAGSRVQVTIEEAGRTKPHLEVEFKATSLSAPYQLQYNPARLSGQNYFVRVKVVDRSGRVLYSTDGQYRLPTQRSAKLNIRVR
ncbi:YbaY family lipoprotein [Deinococcus lacus]|uniref:YbaY family lipoprotein n=1 Tax=Deinococcus lacus TaxID=392561 RepID=A0ABW1YEF3_9DEIO